jgi:hypothetical protein
VNVADLVAIDVHTHAERNTGAWPDPVTEEVLAAAGEVLRRLAATAHSPSAYAAASASLPVERHVGLESRRRARH